MSAAAETGPGERRRVEDERGANNDADRNDEAEEEADNEEAAATAAVSRMERRLRAALGPYEAALRAAQGALVWESPGRSAALGLALNGLFWLLSTTPLRLYFLLAIALLALVWLQTWIHFKHPALKAQWTDNSDTESWAGAQPKLLSLPELCRSLAECWASLAAYRRDVTLYRAQHPDRFCARVCVCCLGFAIVGHYVPGIMIAYIIVASVLLWPLVVYHELIQKMYNRIEPVLMKLDYSMRGGMLGRGHEQRRKGARKEKTEGNEPTAETDSDSEGELSTYCTKVDVKRTALALSITDSELSDEEASILESEGFSISRGSTPPPPPVAAAEHAHDDFDLQSNPGDSPQPRATGRQRVRAESCRGARGAGAAGAPETSGRPGEAPPAPTLRFVDTHFNERASAGRPTAIRELGETLAKEIPRSVDPATGPGAATAGNTGGAPVDESRAGAGSADEATGGTPRSGGTGDAAPETGSGAGPAEGTAAAGVDDRRANGEPADRSAPPPGGCEPGSDGGEVGSAAGAVPGAGTESRDGASAGDGQTGAPASPADAEGDDFELVDEAEVERLGAEMLSSARSAETPGGGAGFFAGFLG